MTTKTGWTPETLKIHFDSLRASDQRALQIKETGDAKALNLAREIAGYKEKKNNELREQLTSERGLYVTKAELKPISDYILMMQGAHKGTEITMGKIYAAIAALGTVMGITLILVNLILIK